MDKILDWLKKLKDKFIAFWNKYTPKQKTVIITVVVAIFLALVLLTYFLTRPVYVKFVDLEDQKAASEMVDALEGDEIPYKVETKNGITTISVQQEYFSKATMLAGSNDLLAEGMTYQEALDNSLSTSAEEKRTKSNLALQTSIRTALLKLDGVSDATVFIDAPEDDGTLMAEKQDKSVSVSLKLKEGNKMDATSAKSVAYFLANAVGSTSTDKIVITDTENNLLFGKLVDDDTLGGNISDTAEFKKKLQNQIADNVCQVLLKLDYDAVEIGNSNIKLDMDVVESLSKTYTVEEGRDEGYRSSSYSYKSEGNNGTSGIPGTDMNADETDVMIQDSGNSSRKTTLEKDNYLPNSVEENRKKEVGAVIPEESSMGVVVHRYKVIREETLEEQGALDDISFEEYSEQNKASTPIDIPEDVVDLVAKTTGIAAENISITGLEKPVFIAKEDSGIEVTNYLMIILALLIAALLVFVIIKGTSPVEVTEMEPELYVEDLLATTAEESALEDIEVNEKSELRILIEKFVDENPEAVALLLRNWLDEDWG